MERIRRTAFQGLKNIIRFNWHFYIIAVVVIIGLLIVQPLIPDAFTGYVFPIVLLILLSTILSLAVSCYVYDYAGLYTLDWLNFLPVAADHRLANIHAGFDETSMLLSEKYPGRNMVVLDFYNPEKHTEISIERARKAYPAFPGTEVINTSTVPLHPGSVDIIFVLLSAHEIRDREERCIFFNELHKSLNSGGKIIVLEHLRDVANFLAYNIGWLHFFSRKEWIYTFNSANLTLDKEVKVTPFLSAFILQKHGTTS